MIFSSITFLFYFLPLFLILYFATPFKNTLLLMASLLFYAWGEVGYTLILIISIGLNYLFGLLINQQNHEKKQLVSLSIGISLNLLLIGYFKYFNFIASSLLGFKQETEVHLPLGISFFTFQAISYLIDVYRKQAKVEKNIFNLALYISMFPQLIAGPIVRFKTVAKQIHVRTHSLNNAVLGIKIFIIGLAQKALIANNVAEPADAIFALNEASLTATTAWFGALCYSFQIYFDFAGYSNMAIGLGLIMGFSFPKNFNYPYISQSITEFWRRWHISLSSWFRDYLYIPLGGNRFGAVRTYINLMLVFLLCGLWHGAAWTFIIWGIYHGLFLIIERLGLSNLLNKSWRPLRHLYTLFVVLIGWVIFRADNFEHLNYYLKSMFLINESYTLVHTLSYYINNLLITSVFLSILFCTPLFPLIQIRILTFYTQNKQLLYVTSSGLIELFYLSVFLLSLINVASGSYNPFIYFRF